MPGFGSSGVGTGPGDGLGSGGIGSVSDGLGFGGSSIEAVGLWVRISLLRRGTLVVAEDGRAQTEADGCGDARGRVGGRQHQPSTRGGHMDSDRIEGKAKQLEGEAQETWGEVKDKARDVKDDVEDALDRDDDREDAPDREPR